MPNEPQIGELSHERRKRFFWILVVIFIISLPSLIFYTTGYRLSFENEETSIVTTGGVYITTDNLEVDVYLDDEQVERPRLFRSAYYIQNIETGQHRVVVQRPDLHTWVKELPVDPYIVTEASAFNVPVVPVIRSITKYRTVTGSAVYFDVSTTSDFFSGVTTTYPYVLSTSTATSSYELNEEYVFVESLFSTTSTSTQSVFEMFLNGMERFRFATTSDSVDSDSSTSTELIVSKGGIGIINRDGELYAVWQEDVSSIPYYFCIVHSSASTTELRYGKHVSDEIERLSVSTTSPLIADDNRVCRPEIKLDRKQKDVYFYDFMPNTSDLVLLQLEDGLYVTEIDDRSWQNVQQLYPGDDFQVIVENDSIFIHENDNYFEIITEIEPN